jgi:molybdopterin molybdotransferase
VKPAENQDSSLLSPFLTANALIRRPANAPAVPARKLVEIVMLK